MFKSLRLIYCLAVPGLIPPLLGQHTANPKTSSYAQLTASEAHLVDSKRSLLEVQLINLRLRIFSILVGHKAAALFGAGMPLTQAQERFVSEEQAGGNSWVAVEKQAQEDNSKVVSSGIYQAINRYNKVEMRRLKLLTILIPGTSRAELEELSAKGVPVDEDSTVKEIIRKYTK